MTQSNRAACLLSNSVYAFNARLEAYRWDAYAILDFVAPAHVLQQQSIGVGTIFEHDMQARITRSVVSGRGADIEDQKLADLDAHPAEREGVPRLI